MLNIESQCTFRVYVEDTDLMGIVYHANYLFYLERARTELLRSAGITLTMMANYGTHFAIYSVEIVYHAPARLDDLLSIRTRCENVRASALLFKQVIHNEADQLLCEATVKVICVNDQLKPKRLPKELIGGG